MTRFDATTVEERRELIADAITAHRERGSSFLTVEADPDDETEDEGEDGDESQPVPWVQYADGLLNVDCTDDELDRLATLLDEYPEATVEERTSPEEAEGTNVRVRVRSDDDRVAGLIDRVFREVYDHPEDFRAWVAEV